MSTVEPRGAFAAAFVGTGGLGGGWGSGGCCTRCSWRSARAGLPVFGGVMRGAMRGVPQRLRDT